jgi:hypothetical protein
MRSTLLLVLAAVVGVALVSPPAADAASCENALKAFYRCSATYDDGGTSEYCLETDLVTPGDGRFVLYVDLAGFVCTCGARGKAPNVKYGTTSTFVCGSQKVALTGKISGTRITGQGLSTVNSAGVRTTFTCRAVPSCS